VTKKAGKKRQKANGSKQSRAYRPDQAAPSAPATLPGIPPPGSALVTIPPAIQAERALQERQRRQKWTGLPKQGKVRKTVAGILALKVQGFNTNEIAEQLNLKPASVRQYLWIAGKKGWLSTSDPHEIAHSQLVHRAVSNAEEWLHARDARTGLPDKEFTIEAMKGFRLFNTGGPAEQSEQHATNVLAIQITMPQSGNLPQMREGNAGGQAAYTEGEVISVAPIESRRQLPE
jgi:uncharacterized protein YdbL (DUF1318 family)